jgi:integrase
MAPLDNSTSLEEWAKLWLRNKESTIAETTHANYEHTMRHVIPALGKFKLKDIKTVHIQTLVNDMHAKGYSRSMMEKVKSVLYGMLQEAEINDMVMRNVCRGVRLPKVERKQVKDAFTLEEVQIIDQNADTIDNCDIISILANTGLREGEFLALRHEDIDYKESCLHVTHAATRTKTGLMKLSKPKTLESIRTIPLSVKTLALLKRLDDNRKSEYLYSNNAGGIVDAKSFYRIYKRTVAKLGIRYLPPHCCRHTYATLLHAAGVDFKTIQTLMGHTDYALTANIYTHVKPAQLRHAVDALNTLKQGESQQAI